MLKTGLLHQLPCQTLTRLFQRAKNEGYLPFVVSLSVLSSLILFVFLCLKGNKIRHRQHGVTWMFGLSPHEFRRAFRMSRHTFFVLLHLVEDALLKDIYKAKNSSGSPVTPLVKLAATIRWLAGACIFFSLSYIPKLSFTSIL
jgi:hypothetical protein